MKRFELKTLVDITPTGRIRFGQSPADNFLRNQQRNYETLLQILGLKAQIQVISCTSAKELFPTHQDYQMVWTLVFEYEFDWSIDLQTLQQDLQNIPIIDKLNNTVDFVMPVIDLAGNTNTILKEITDESI